jgi:hypothetical protein
MKFISLIIGDSVASNYRTNSYNSFGLHASSLLVGFESIILLLMGLHLTTILSVRLGQLGLSGFLIAVNAWLILVWAVDSIIAFGSKYLPKAEKAL